MDGTTFNTIGKIVKGLYFLVMQYSKCSLFASTKWNIDRLVVTHVEELENLCHALHCDRLIVQFHC
jgi:hypothetical protein